MKWVVTSMKYFGKDGLIDALLFLVGGAISGFLSMLPIPTIALMVVGFVLVVVGFSMDGYIGAFLIGFGSVAASGLTGYVKGLVGGGK